jgi:hypothetical protein
LQTAMERELELKVKCADDKWSRKPPKFMGQIDKKWAAALVCEVDNNLSKIPLTLDLLDHFEHSYGKSINELLCIWTNTTWYTPLPQQALDSVTVTGLLLEKRLVSIGFLKNWREQYVEPANSETGNVDTKKGGVPYTFDVVQNGDVIKLWFMNDEGIKPTVTINVNDFSIENCWSITGATAQHKVEEGVKYTLFDLFHSGEGPTYSFIGSGRKTKAEQTKLITRCSRWPRRSPTTASWPGSSSTKAT